jgi:hypothetical protein
MSDDQKKAPSPPVTHTVTTDFGVPAETLASVGSPAQQGVVNAVGAASGESRASGIGTLTNH